MAISPPSDLVLDVVRAADPTQVQEAQAKLKSNRAAFEATSLAEAGAGFQAAVGILNRDSVTTHAAKEGVSAVGGKAIPEHLRKFETMVLQNFVKSMLPAESEDTYGKGTAGEMWRGMMADQLGEVLSKGGGIGIAESLAKKSGVTVDPKEKDVDRVAAGMVQSMQREAFADLTPGIKEHDKKA
ncbi:rod-binding protein [Shinella zoogloeoides]|uniref:Rod-binding protein n=1 Tax=Shinella zoogloeoides TaxID=352475 RepID=A0A6N8TFC7_SHIZO|nr:rod-binding protein [Shinella zoogloeoides]MXO01659.1 rod-binding protein [Shinella zoogloeoides]UEX82106.1 rod-binding protein [Shinella zoogloeoides]